MKFTLSQRFSFDAAHTLDRSESSRRIHGHTYHCEISIVGAPDERGMVLDLSGLQAFADVIKVLLDHRFLDEIQGLGPATLENLCAYISRLVPFQLHAVKVWRADGGSCLLEVQ